MKKQADVSEVVAKTINVVVWLLTAALAYLKLRDIIMWPWPWVLSPALVWMSFLGGMLAAIYLENAANNHRVTTDKDGV
jgi:hypothetical protein